MTAHLGARARVINCCAAAAQVVAAALVALVLTAAPADAATLVLAAQAQPTKVAAYGGRIMWSAYDPTRKLFFLTEQIGDRSPQRLSVRPRRIPFDVDLGPGPAGAVDAVYSRCRRENTNFAHDPTYLPLWEQERGCRLYALDLRTGREARVVGEHAGRADSDYLPTIWHRRLAFARVHASERVPVRREGPPRLVLLNTATGQSAPVAGGPRGEGGAGGDPLYATGPGPLELDLRGSTLAYDWGFYRNDCVRNNTDNYLDPFTTQLRIAAPRRASRVIAQACEQTTPSAVIAGNYSGSDVYYATAAFYGNTPDNTIIRRSASGARSTTKEPRNGEAFIVSVARADHATIVATVDTSKTSRQVEVLKITP